MPDHVDKNPPARRPWTAQKTYRAAMVTAKPQPRNTDRTVPTVEIKITVVTWSRSQRNPVVTERKTDARFTMATVRELVGAQAVGVHWRINRWQEVS